MNLKPLFGRVLLERKKTEKIGSILLPNSAAERHASLKCRVLALGENADPSVKVGSWVLIGKHAGTWLDENGNPVPNDEARFFIVQDEDILCEVGDD